MGILEKIDETIKQQQRNSGDADDICHLLTRLLKHIKDWKNSDAYPIEKPIKGFKASFKDVSLASRQQFICKKADTKYIYVGVDGSQYTNSGYTKFTSVINGGIVLHSIGENGIYKSLEVIGVPPLTHPGDIDRERFILEAKIAKCIGIKLKGELPPECSYCTYKNSCEIRSFDIDYSDLKPVIFMDYPLETLWFEGIHERDDLESRINAHLELLRFSNEEDIPLIGVVSSSRSRDLYTHILDEIQKEFTQGFATENSIQTTLEPITKTVLKWALEHKDQFKLYSKKGLILDELINAFYTHKPYNDWKILCSFCPDMGDRTSSFRYTRKTIREWYPYPINFFFVNTFPDWTRISYTGCANPEEVYHHFLYQSAGMPFFYPFVLHRAHHKVAARPEIRMLIENRISELMNSTMRSKALSKKMAV